MRHNEDTRVKLPAILHLVRLGYEYISLKDADWDEDTNIFTNIFEESLMRINPGMEIDTAKRIYQEVILDLDNEDLGKAFFERLSEQSGVKLIDFSNFENNSFHVVTELTYKNGEDEFRPDIILLINGMPLVFIEVKKPHNRDGIIAERNRINARFQNKKFRKFVNLTQLMIFSNNMEYDKSDPEPFQGAFYASPSYHEPIFNYFREEEKFDLETLLRSENEEVETFLLKDTNYQVVKGSPEFLTNKNPNNPTNRILTSLVSKQRLAFVLKYAFAYVKETNGLQKHIMRYPQLFATKAIETKLNEGIRKGIIWHTQGSGKTALAFYNVQFLTDYFQNKKVIPKFYFIVDRLDLLTQAKREFSSRGLIVHTVNSRKEFLEELKITTALHNFSGKPEITVVNIHKFKDDPDMVRQKDYDINIQRIYFLDEVHRSYNPKGSFLANLTQSDKNAIKIGLTGTPLLSSKYDSTDLFGGYIHKYYYNASIADGYTLRLIREEIETNYKIALAEALKEIEVLQKDLPKKKIYAHPKFVEPMLDYMIEDFEKFRTINNDNSVGAMVVCDSSDQARMLYEIFKERFLNIQTSTNEQVSIAADPDFNKKKKDARKVKRAALILHDAGAKEELKQRVEDFKEGKIDFLFVYNMLLTGFDAKRLKKLYLGRVIKRHNLLQTLTRVNRTYKKFRYGYVVDFADIRKEFDATNKDYFDELQKEHGDEIEHYSNLFKSKEEIEDEIAEIKELLFHFDTKNKEVFSQQIAQISDRKEMLKIVKALNNAKSLYNLIRLFGHFDLLEKIDFRMLTVLSRDANNHLQMINAKEALESNIDTTNLLNVALEDVIFMFAKINTEELILADNLKDSLRKTREEMADNFDPKDPEFVSLYDALKALFNKNNLSEVTQEDMKRNIGALREIHDKIKELNRKNRLLQAKYDNDTKYARIHKRLKENGTLSKRESEIFEALKDVKAEADESVFKNNHMLDNEDYFSKMMIQLVVKQLKNKFKMNAETSKYVNNLVVKEYMDEYYGRTYDNRY